MTFNSKLEINGGGADKIMSCRCIGRSPISVKLHAYDDDSGQNSRLQGSEGCGIEYGRLVIGIEYNQMQGIIRQDLFGQSGY